MFEFNEKKHFSRTESLMIAVGVIGSCFGAFLFLKGFLGTTPVKTYAIKYWY